MSSPRANKTVSPSSPWLGAEQYAARRLKEYDSLSFPVHWKAFGVHIADIRGTTQINALSLLRFEGTSAVLEVASSTSSWSSSSHRAPCSPAWQWPPPLSSKTPPPPIPSCHHGLVYELLPWKDRLMEESARSGSGCCCPPASYSLANKTFHLLPCLPAR